MTVLSVDFGLRQLVRREADVIRPESTEDQVRREVMKRCLAAGVPLRMAQIQADTACNTVRAGHDPVGAITRAVDRATKNAFPDSQPPSAA